MKKSTPATSQDFLRSKVNNNISYQTLECFDGAKSAGTFCADGLYVPRKKAPVEGQIVPISNLPADSSDKYEGGMPSTRDFKVYRLQREVRALRDTEKNLLGKLSRALEIISDMERFLDVGLKHNQWETYGELMRRKERLSAFREMIIDVSAESHVAEEVANALKQKLIL